LFNNFGNYTTGQSGCNDASLGWGRGEVRWWWSKGKGNNSSLGRVKRCLLYARHQTHFTRPAPTHHPSSGEGVGWGEVGWGGVVWGGKCQGLYASIDLCRPLGPPDPTSPDPTPPHPLPGRRIDAEGRGWSCKSCLVSCIERKRLTQPNKEL
jgi:hypothetical protein